MNQTLIGSRWYNPYRPNELFTVNLVLGPSEQLGYIIQYSSSDGYRGEITQKTFLENYVPVP